MNKVKPSIAAAFFLAALGFSWALATSPAPDAAPRSVAVDAQQVGARAVGTPLRFTNAFVLAGSDPAFPLGGSKGEPQGFDLGDACSNVAVMRYLNAAGGFLPYSFATRPNFDFLGFGTTALPKVVQYGNGKIIDQYSTFSGPNYPGVSARFNAIVTDYLGTQRTGIFRINVVPCPGAMRFAQDRLPVAQLGASYFTNLEVLAPPGSNLLPAKFSLSSAVVAGGKTFTRLEDVGLTLTPDGLIFGRPCVLLAKGAATTQTIAFTVRASDPSGVNFALSRDGKQIDQPLTLSVEFTSQAVSEVMAARCAMALITNGTTTAKDSLTYSGFFDPKGETNFSLAGTPFTLRLGADVFTGNFDAKGKFKSALNANGKAKPSAVKKAGSFEVSASTAKGTLDIKFKNATLGDAFAFSNGSASGAAPIEQPIIFCFEFKHYRTCEALVMSAKTKGFKSALQYRVGEQVRTIGKTKVTGTNAGRSLSGGFQVLGVTGQDQKLKSSKTDPGVDGDAWIVRWMGVPRYGIDASALTAFPLRNPVAGATQSASLNVTIRIGSSFTQTVAAPIKSVRLRFKGKGTDAGLYSVVIDGARFVHSLQTNTLTEDATQLPQAGKSTNPTIFRFGMDVPNFSGECGRVIAPNNSIWGAH